MLHASEFRVSTISNNEFQCHPHFLQQDSQLRLHRRGDGERVSPLDVLQHLVVAEALEGEAAERDGLVEEDAVGPDVGHGREEALAQALGGHPTDGEHAWRERNRGCESARENQSVCPFALEVFLIKFQTMKLCEIHLVDHIYSIWAFSMIWS